MNSRTVLWAAWMAIFVACSGREIEVADVREACVVHEPRRQPLFGDLHVHTRLSFDAFPWDPPLGPRDAYLFARGEEVEIPPRGADGERLRAKLRRPLDFAAVTDHSEGLGETGVCMNPASLGYSSAECMLYRGDVSAIGPDQVYLLFGTWFFGDPLPTARSPMSFCFLPGVDCPGAEAHLWQEIRDAAEEFYDRSSECQFTTFVGYEWTGTPLGSNLHRNVIFRNANVTRLPISKVDTGTDPKNLWKRLRSECLDAGSGCDVLSIPHNPNLSAGQQFLDPESPAEAALQAELEPLVEIMQAKGSSECRLGLGTEDELCDFELLSNGTFFPFPRPALLGPEFTERSFVRNILKEGLRLGREGANPWRMGFTGSTDTHFGTPGNVDEGSFQGTHPTTASRAELVEEIENNPGGLTVVWAEENSRDALFDALRRRETYATSGTRPTVRVFGGFDLPIALCDSGDPVGTASAAGVPMGGILADPPDGVAAAPRFAVLAAKDPDGVALQAVQVVKGWVDTGGETHERVFDVAGDRTNGAAVDPADCTPTGSGHDSLCTVWSDPEFDPASPAFWYVRVLENPRCRWSTRFCQENGVNPLGDACEEEAAAAGHGLAACCDDDPVTPVIQERAWTSPIWWEG